MKKILFFCTLFISNTLFAYNNNELLIPLLKNDHINNIAGFLNDKNKKKKVIIKTKIIYKYKILKNPVIYFDFNSYKLKPKYIKLLNQIAKNNKNNIIFIKGYSDKPGNENYNLYLSKFRAETVKNYLIKKGINSKNIFVKYYGNKNLIVNTKNKNNLNRRVILSIYPKPN